MKIEKFWQKKIKYITQVLQFEILTTTELANGPVAHWHTHADSSPSVGLALGLTSLYNGS